MSGFGGSGAFGSAGFGGSPNNPQGGFGGGFGSAAPPQPSQQTFGGFGAFPVSSSSVGSSQGVPPPTAFGSSPHVATGFGSALVPSSGGFGGNGIFGSAPPPSGFGAGGFGSSTPAQGGSGFGSAPSSGFGSAPSSGFGSAPSSGFGSAPSSGFDSAPSSGFGRSSGGGFGSAAAAPPASVGGFSAALPTGFDSNAGGFGSAPASSFGKSGGGFGSNAGGGFGSNSGDDYGSNTSAPVPGFGSTSNAASTGFSGGFGAAPTSAGFGTGPSPNGFGSVPSSGLAFGTSSNVMTASIPHSNSRFGQSNSGAWGLNPNASSHPHHPHNPLGSGPSGFVPSGDANNDDGMMDGGGPMAGFLGGETHRDARNNITFRPNTANQGGPEAGMGGGYDDSEAVDLKKAEVSLKAKIEQKKRLLEAKLEEKRKKLLEKQGEMKTTLPVPGKALDAGASPFVPKNDANSLAARNALRFGDQSKSSSSRDMLPAEIRNQATMGQMRVPSPEVTGTFDQQKSTRREDLLTAKALVGTCEFFCPDEELLRREGENDIQQLETPLPGKLHPADWTLRNTVVKRFRRSAADYKLDVPEWVRPPDVLERVCGYLEEWVMVRDGQGPTF
jgi:SAC3/GANP family